jgi:hypothetical protein
MYKLAVMNKNDQFYTDFNDENPDRDKKLKDELAETININDLAFNEEANSFELDVESDDAEYDHPDPYDTSVTNGGDADSSYDQDNPTAVHEYDKDLSLESDAEKLAMHIDDGSIVQVDAIDKELAKTPEDQRDDLDEEGYPKNDEVAPL